MKPRANPMHRLKQANVAPRCSAMSKRSGSRCGAPAVKGRPVCRMHGARAGAPSGKANGAWRHGLSTKVAVDSRRGTAAMLRLSRKFIRAI